MTTAEQTEGGGACVSPAPANGGTPMAPPTDVCEAFCLFCVICGFYVFRFQLLAFSFQLSEAFSCVLCILWFPLYLLSAFSF
jgi:hypothetical protein